MVYARFIDPDAGWDHDKETCVKAGLIRGNLYRVSDVNMFGWYTDIYLEEFGNLAFNSVHFEFEEDGELIDIYRDHRFNHCMEDR